MMSLSYHQTEKTCLNCENIFKPSGKNQKYCSLKCREIIANIKKKLKYDPKKKQEYYFKNKIEINKKKTIYKRNKTKIDCNYKLRNNLRSRLNKAIKGDYKSGSAVKDLGCSIPDFKLYVESKWLPGMSWENYGLHGWHIDHIKPLKSFKLENREELLKACHYTNLQPLWSEDNLIKGCKSEPPVLKL